jgi:hypothetical protein
MYTKIQISIQYIIYYMSTTRVEEKHQKLLDKILAKRVLRGAKISKTKLIGKLIEEAAISEGICGYDDDIIPFEEDPAWKGLQITYDLGISDLSERVDEFHIKNKSS